MTGPSTETTVAFEQLNGNALKTGNGKDASLASTCATDVFHVTNAPNLPELCGTLSGEHGMSNFNYIGCPIKLYD